MAEVVLNSVIDTRVADYPSRVRLRIDSNVVSYMICSLERSPVDVICSSV
jgi:hypothetical protein